MARANKGREAVHIRVPRWTQAVLLPIVILLVIYFGGIVSHALLVFLLAGLLSLLLNPLVAGMNRLRVPRALGVALVFLSFLAAIVVVAIVAVPPVIAQFRNLIDKAPQLDQAFTSWVQGIQNWLFQHYNITVDILGQINRGIASLQTGWTTVAGRLFSLGIGFLGVLATFVVVVFTTLYMLIDGRRIHRFLVRVAPMPKEAAERYFRGVQVSFTRYVRGQALLGLSVGMAAGLAVWVLGWKVVGIWPEGAQYALLFGAFAGITELVPYIGPWVGAAPAVILAFFHSAEAGIWVAALFLLIQELEGHILVPNIIGSSVGVHPLVVIFGVLCGAQIGGILGILAVLPVLALAKWIFDFFDVRLSKAPWILDDGVIARVSGPEPPLGSQTAPSPVPVGKETGGVAPSREGSESPGTGV